MYIISAIELIKDLMGYEIKDMLLRGLVKLLRPTKEDLLLQRAEAGDGKTNIESERHWVHFFFFFFFLFFFFFFFLFFFFFFCIQTHRFKHRSQRIWVFVMSRLKIKSTFKRVLVYGKPCFAFVPFRNRCNSKNLISLCSAIFDFLWTVSKFHNEILALIEMNSYSSIT